MIKKISILLSLLFISSYHLLGAQEKKITDTLANNKEGVVIHADPRIDMLVHETVKVKKAEIAKTTKVIRSGRGFRIQIYNGNEKAQAINKKIDFMRRFPEVATYMTYTQPLFRVKVGNFQSRKEAQTFMSQIGSFYGTAMIVPDFIVINTFKKHD